MGNFISFSQCCGDKNRLISIFGKPKKRLNKSLHTAKPLIIIYSTTPPYFIEEGNLVNY